MKYLSGLLSLMLLISMGCKSSQTLLSETVPDGFNLEIKKTACFGTCPVFTLEVTDNGQVIYQGKAHVDLIGNYSKQLSPEKMVALVEIMRSSNFWNYEKSYDDPNVTDLPMTRLACSLDGESLTVISRVGAPEEMKFLVKMLLDVIGKEGFVSTDS